MDRTSDEQIEALQNSAAFRHLQKQISKLRKHYLSEGYSPQQVIEMLQLMLLQKQNQSIDWMNLTNTNEFYDVMEKYSGTSSQVAQSTLKFKQEISQISSLPSSTTVSSHQNESSLVQRKQSSSSNSPSKNMNSGNRHQQGIVISDIDEISDRFLYRLEKKCCIDKESSSSSSGSSSGSESSDHEQYQYKLNQNLIQSEIALDQIPSKKQSKNSTDTKPGQANGPTEVNIENEVFNVADINLPRTQQQKKKALKQKRRLPVQNSKGECGISNTNPSVASSQSKAVLSPLMEQAHFFNDQCEFEILQSKKQCRRQLESQVHSQLGKKRAFLYRSLQNNMSQQSGDHLELDLSAFGDMQLFEKKFRYLAEHDLLPSPPGDNQQEDI